MHPTDGELRAMIDGETSAQQRAEVAAHLSGCAPCAIRLGALEGSASLVGGLLDLTDLPPAVLDSGALMERAAALPRRRPAVIAATLTLLAAAAAATVVGPRVVRTFTYRAPAAPPASAAAPATAQRPSRESAVEITPGNDVTVLLAAVQSAGTLYLAFSLDSSLALRSTAPVDYRVHAGGIVVSNAGSDADYDLVLPRAGGRVVVRVAGRVVFERLPGGTVRSSVQAGTDGRYAIPVR